MRICTDPQSTIVHRALAHPAVAAKNKKYKPNIYSLVILSAIMLSVQQCHHSIYILYLFLFPCIRWKMIINTKQQ